MSKSLSRKRDHGRAEALLLAEWARRQEWEGKGAGSGEMSIVEVSPVGRQEVLL